MIKGGAWGSGELTGAHWRKSSYSGTSGTCVEVAEIGNGRAVRDAKDPAGPALGFTLAEWSAFTAAVGAGEFG